MTRQARSAARHAGAQDARVAGRGHHQDAGDVEGNEERDAVVRASGRLKIFTAPTIEKSASAAATISAATLIPRVHRVAGRTVVSAVTTK